MECGSLLPIPGPLNYLILIGQIGLLPALFEKVVLPIPVQSELASIGRRRLAARHTRF